MVAFSRVHFEGVLLAGGDHPPIAGRAYFLAGSRVFGELRVARSAACQDSQASQLLISVSPISSSSLASIASTVSGWASMIWIK
jgi:hypothetical protein